MFAAFCTETDGMSDNTILSPDQIETSSLFFSGDLRPSSAIPFTTFSDSETITLYFGNSDYESNTQLGRIQLSSVAFVDSFTVEYRKVDKVMRIT